MLYLLRSLTNKKYHHFFAIFIFTVLFFVSSMASYASSDDGIYPAEVTETQSGIVKIISSCMDDAGNKYYVHSGNGFVIGTNGSQQYILTDYQLVVPSEDDYTQIRRGVGLSTNTKLTNKIYIYFPGDISIEATVTASNEQAGYALLQPASTLNNLTYMQLGSTADINRKQTVYLPGYTGDFSLLGQEAVPSYSYEIKDYTISFIEHESVNLKIDGSPSTGKAGAPLVNESGDVIGIMCYDKTEGCLKVVPAETLILMLNTLGIKYYDTDPSNEYNLADFEIVNEFETLLSECQQDVMMNEDKYSKSSLQTYKDAIQKAVEVSNKTDSTKDDYQNCIDALTSAKKKLKPANYIYIIIQVILLVVILFFIQINIRQVLKGKKLKESMQPTQAKARKKKRKQIGALIRIDTGEVIWLTKKGLRIGKNPKEVDYCISNDSTISRLHATILYDNEHFYIVDNYSTNKTSINHSYIEPQKSYELFDEDTISISNISFTFRHLINM